MRLVCGTGSVNGMQIFPYNNKRISSQMTSRCIWWSAMGKIGEHITDAYITETDTTELQNLSRNIIDTFINET